MIVYALLAVACSQPDAPPATETGTPSVVETGDSGDSGPVPDDSAITYYEDIRPIVDRACARCHAENTQAFSFNDAATVVGYADLIASETAARRRPPPVADRTCAAYTGDAWYVSDDDIATFAAWAEANTPLGDPANASPPWERTTIGPYDRTLTMPQPWAPTTDNRYRCYELPLGNTAPTYLRGLEVQAGNESIAHFAVVYLLPPGVTTREGRNPQGYDCGGLGEPGWQLLTGWMPGAQGLKFPEGSGLPLPADTRFVFQMHYRYTAYDAGSTDQSALGLLLADSVARPITRLDLGPTGFTIPAGDPNYAETTEMTWTSPDAEVLAVSTRMNHLSAGLEVTAGTDDACVARYTRYDAFSPYPILLQEPRSIRNGDPLRATCRWNNSDTSPYQMYHPPQDARDGVSNDSETCKVTMYVVPK